MEITGSLTASGTGGAGNFSFSLPSGYTIDAGSINTAGRAAVGSFSMFDSGVGHYTGTASRDTDTTIVFTTNQTIASLLQGNAITLNDTLGWSVSVPISQWTGSGTVNLGPGAQVEYAAWNGTSTVYGPAGFSVPTITASAVATTTIHNITFQYPIQASDRLVLEVKRADVSYWVPVGSTASDSYAELTLQNAGANRWYGMGLQRDSSDPRKVIVEFGNAGARTTGNGYASVGSNFPIAANDVYRVTKATQSAPVGFGLAGTDGSSGLYKPGQAPGYTGGVAIPAGYVGELAGTAQTGGTGGSPYLTVSSTAPTGAITSMVSQTVNKGVYLVSVYGQVQKAANANADRFAGYIYIGGTQVAGTLAVSTTVNVSGAYTSIAVTCPVVITADSTAVSFQGLMASDAAQSAAWRLGIVRIA